MANSYVGAPYSLIAARPVAVTAAQRHVMIAEAAHFLAQRHGFTPGGGLDDWVRAEQQVDASLGRQHC